MSRQRELTLVKGQQNYIFRYESGSEDAVLDTFVDLAQQRNGDFDWFDAAVLSFQLSKHLVEEADRLLCSPSD